jgi:hypothetical protein
MNLKIDRNWRKWEDKKNDKRAPRVVVGSEERSGASQASRPNKNSTPSKIKLKTLPTSKTSNKSNKMYDAGKELYAGNKIISKNSKTPKYDTDLLYKKAQSINKKIGGDKLLPENTIKELEKRIDNIYEFESQLSYSPHSNNESKNPLNEGNVTQKFSHNENSSRSLGINYYKSRNKRYGTEFANLIGKLAEDNTGVDIDGDDFWDENLLTERVVSKYAINKCKKDRTKERIVLMLDTSPSCKRVASFYGLIAQLAAKYNDIELYDAPNGRIVHKYCRRTKDFVPIWNEEDIHNRAYEWEYLKNRTVLLFSDSDCIPVIEKNLGVNNIILMSHYPDNENYRNSRLMNIAKELQNLGGNVYFGVNNPDKLVEVIKKLK